jgi:U4/U6.U5 tri-snRNP-associated protein 2
VLLQATQQWYEIQDLHVTETMPQMIGLSESYLLVYQRKGASAAQVPIQMA